MTDYHYCKDWFLERNLIIDPWTVEKARKAHKAGKPPYTVLVGSDKKPECVIYLDRNKMKFISVTFLDKLCRKYMSFGYFLEEDGLLWLNSTTKFDYTDDGDEPDQIFSTNFALERGKVWVHIGKRMFERIAGTGDQHIQYSEFYGGEYDISRFCMPWPEFGEYGALVKSHLIAWEDIKPVGPVKVLEKRK